MDNKKKGSVWEYGFFAEAMKRGYDVFIPAGDHLPIDCVVQNSAGQLLKVQVKGTTRNCPDKRNFARYKVLAGTGSSSKSPLDCTKVDILAVYVACLDVWYIIPCMALDGKVGLWFYPDNQKSKAKYETYKEAWDCLKGFSV